VFVEHFYYWGDVLVDELFGEPSTRYAHAQAAFAAGIRATLRNDETVTPLQPFRTVSVAMSRLGNAADQLGWATRVAPYLAGTPVCGHA